MLTKYLQVLIMITLCLILSCDNQQEEKLDDNLEFYAVLWYDTYYRSSLDIEDNNSSRFYITEIYQNSTLINEITSEVNGSCGKYQLEEGQNYQIIEKTYNIYNSETEPLFISTTDIFDIDINDFEYLNSAGMEVRVNTNVVINENFYTDLNQLVSIDFSNYQNTILEDDKTYTNGYEHWYSFIPTTEKTKVVFNQDGYSAMIPIYTSYYNKRFYYTSFIVDTTPGQRYFFKVENILSNSSLSTENLYYYTSNTATLNVEDYLEEDYGSNSFESAGYLTQELVETSTFEKPDDIDYYKLDVSKNCGYIFSSDYPINLELFDEQFNEMKNNGERIFKDDNYYINTQDNSTIYIKVEPENEKSIMDYDLLVNDVRNLDLLVNVRFRGECTSTVNTSPTDEVVLRIIEEIGIGEYETLHEFIYSGSLFPSETYYYGKVLELDPIWDRENLYVEAGIRDSEGIFFSATNKSSLLPPVHDNIIDIRFFHDRISHDLSHTLNTSPLIGIENLIYRSPYFRVTYLKEFLREEVPDILSYATLVNKPDSSLLESEDIIVVVDDYNHNKYYMNPDVPGDYEITFYYGTEMEIYHEETYTFTAELRS